MNAKSSWRHILWRDAMNTGVMYQDEAAEESSYCCRVGVKS